MTQTEQNSTSPDHHWITALHGCDPLSTGIRLRKARKQAGLLQAGAASVLGVSRPTYVTLEQGARLPRPDELATLARLYGVTPLSLLTPEEKQTSLAAPFAAKGIPAVTQAAQRLEQLARSGLDLRVRCGFRHTPRPAGGQVNYELQQDRDAQYQGEQAGRSERRRLGVHGPLKTLRALAETHYGLQVYGQDLGDGQPDTLSGLGAAHPLLGRCLLLNTRTDAAVRHRTLALSLGVFLFCPERLQSWKLFPDGDRRASPGSGLGAAVHAFADELLTPAAELLWDVRDLRATSPGRNVTPEELIRLARRYTAPVSSLLNRLVDLNFITPEEQDLVYAWHRQRPQRDVLPAGEAGTVLYPEAHWQAALRLLLAGETSSEALLVGALSGVSPAELDRRVRGATEFTDLDGQGDAVTYTLRDPLAPVPLRMN